LLQGCQEDDDELSGNLASRFEAVIGDVSAGHSPHLPIQTIQALAMEHCKMHPKDVSEDVLNYDSSMIQNEVFSFVA
jgi:hypothetical protein